MKRYRLVGLLAPLALGACVSAAPIGADPVSAAAAQATPVPLAADPSFGIASASAGGYQLVAINGKPLPMVVSRYEGCEELLLDSSLHLYDDMTYAVHTTMREVCPNGTDLNLEGELGRYTLSGSRVQFDDEAIEKPRLNRWEGAGNQPRERSIPIEDLSGAATVSGDAITVALGGGRHTATFRR